ncbi:MAG: hypothetical protein ACLTZN_01610 [Streptococcus sp.]
MHEQTNIVGEGLTDYQEAATPNYYNTQTNMGGEDPSPKQDYGDAIPNYYNTSQDQYASPFSLINVDKKITLGEHLLIISEVTGLLMALRPEKVIGHHSLI